MPTHLRLTVTFLDPVPAFHGRGDGGEPEWPPSPLRAYQALVAAGAARLRQNFESAAGGALRWLESLPPPQIVCPPALFGTPVRTAVPNNDLDVWSKDVAQRKVPDKQPSELKTLKTVRPTWLRDGTAVRYVWSLADSGPPPDVFHTLRELAHGLSHLGWGIDQAVGHLELLDTEPPCGPVAERWVPGGDSTALRAPRPGTLADLTARHRALLGRFQEGGYDHVPPPTMFDRVGYRNTAEPAGRLWAAFELLNPDADEGGRVSFDPARHTRCVAAWVRHAVAAVCEGWPAEYGTVERFVHGHDGPDRPAKGDGADQRFQYLPLPTIERRPDAEPVVGAIRRVLVAAPPGCERQIDWLKQRLGGRPLEWDGQVVGLLNRLAADDWVGRQYTRPATGWSTVTPVLLPGFDDRDRRKAERLLWQAFEDAGLAPDVLAGAEAEWRAVGFRPGVEPARRYAPPDNLDRFPRYHVRVRFRRPVSGPLAAGAGRYRGFGVFAAEQ